MRYSINTLPHPQSEKSVVDSLPYHLPYPPPAIDYLGDRIDYQNQSSRASHTGYRILSSTAPSYRSTYRIPHLPYLCDQIGYNTSLTYFPWFSTNEKSVADRPTVPSYRTILSYRLIRLPYLCDQIGDDACELVGVHVVHAQMPQAHEERVQRDLVLAEDQGSATGVR